MINKPLLLKGLSPYKTKVAGNYLGSCSVIVSTFDPRLHMPLSTSSKQPVFSVKRGIKECAPRLTISTPAVEKLSKANLLFVNRFGGCPGRILRNFWRSSFAPINLA